jgi:hypothetical protein
MHERLTLHTKDETASPMLSRRQFLKEAVIGAGLVTTVLAVPALRDLSSRSEKNDIPFVPLRELLAAPDKYREMPIRTEGYVQFSYAIQFLESNAAVGIYHMKETREFVDRTQSPYNPSVKILDEAFDAKYLTVEYRPHDIPPSQQPQVPNMIALEGKVTLTGSIMHDVSRDMTNISYYLITNRIETD